ncbi:outer membrane beta-barrel protein [Mucilaginibacter litoreus]|uniref:Outer membrane beta-barrel protein n=1 Tax=Mucilaginibacter litoreus TaxID=1048221 RepID=A0ABW3ANU4_9SPHI
MKKIALVMVVLCSAALTTFAQTSDAVGRFSIGLEAGLPTTSGYSFIIGGSLKYEHPIQEGLFLTGSIGYSRVKMKSVDTGLSDEDMEDLEDLGIDTDGLGGGSFGIIPIKVGAKYYFAEKIFGEAQLGAGINTQSGGGTSFIYSPGVGYNFSNNFEGGLRYEGWSNNGTLGQLGVRLAYKF